MRDPPTEPAQLFFVLLTPEENAITHLSQLAEIARLLSDSTRIEAIAEARSARELEDAINVRPGRARLTP